MRRVLIWSDVAALLALGLVLGADHDQAVTITTADGDGADAFVERFDNGFPDREDTNYGTDVNVRTRAVVGLGLYRKSYLRFDLSGITGEIVSASFGLTGNNSEAAGEIINVYGLTDGVTGDGAPGPSGWIENGDPSITFNNAPANDTSGIGLTADATLLGTFVKGFVDATTEFTDPALVTFLNNDSNGLVTLIVAPSTTAGGDVSWHSKEGPGTAPTLSLTVAPAPFSLTITSNGADLDLTWDSRAGMFYVLRSSTDLAADLATWDSINVPGSVENNGVFEIAANPPLNSHRIPRPGDPVRFYRVEEFPTPPQSVFSGDFEGGQGGWTTGGDPGSDPFTNWEFGAPTVVGPAAANSGANCFGTNLAAGYANDADLWLRSPAIDLTAAGGATLNFSHYVDIEENFDSGQVWLLDADAANAELAILEMNIDGNNPAGWEAFSKSLPAAALGKNVVIEFRFSSDNFNDPTQAGWYIDDVLVTASL